MTHPDRVHAAGPKGWRWQVCVIWQLAASTRPLEFQINNIVPDCLDGKRAALCQSKHRIASNTNNQRIRNQLAKVFCFFSSEKKTFLTSFPPLTRAPRCRPRAFLDHVMVDPLGHEAAGFAEAGFGVVDAVERGAALEGGHVVGAVAAQFAVGGYHRASAPPPDFCHARLQLRLIRNTGLLYPASPSAAMTSAMARACLAAGGAAGQKPGARLGGKRSWRTDAVAIGIVTRH